MTTSNNAPENHQPTLHELAEEYGIEHVKLDLGYAIEKCAMKWVEAGLIHELTWEWASYGWSIYTNLYLTHPDDPADYTREAKLRISNHGGWGYDIGVRFNAQTESIPLVAERVCAAIAEFASA